jgi:two-component system, LytTR family, sensor kinase
MRADLNSSAIEDTDSLIASGADRAFRRMLVLATGLLWAANFAIMTLMSIAGGDAGWTALLLPRLALNLVGVGICYLLHRVLQWAGGAGFRRQLLVAAIATPAAADGYAWCSTYAVWLMHGDTPPMPAAQVILQLALHFWFFATWTGFYLAISYGARLRVQQQREATARILAQAAQLQALHYQISPHFLFNTLNSISSLVADGKSGLAETMVQHLSEFLRLTLTLDPALDVTIEQELALQNAYLEIERARFPDMELDVRVAEDVRNAPVPGLILQPLIENAVKHGIATHLGTSTIQISATRAGDLLAVEITNQAQAGAPDGRSGIGLRNVRERLAARFGDMASLTAGFVRPGRYAAKLLIPIPT